MHFLVDKKKTSVVECRKQHTKGVRGIAQASFKVEFPRRQAILAIREPHYKDGIFEYQDVAHVPVFVWPMPTTEGLFVVEYQDGTVQRVQPDSLTFLDSKELFDQYGWEEE